MQQFVVPQFIEVEDKILGPITVRQFLILLVTGIILFIFFKFGDFALFITALVIFGGLAVVFAFGKVNGQTFHYFVLNVIQTLRRPPLRVWNKGYTKDELEILRKHEETAEEEIIAKKELPRHDHIRDLSLVVNTGGYYQPDDEN